jgi:hypothetical protein
MQTASLARMAHVLNTLSLIVIISGASTALAGDRRYPEDAADETSNSPAPPTVRAERRLSLGVATPWPIFARHDATIPVPALRIGVNLSPRFMAELTGGRIPFEYDGEVGLLEAGFRVFIVESSLAPYGVARAGIYFDDSHEQGPPRNYPYLQPVGVGLDYSGSWGFTASAEIGPTLMWYSEGGDHSLQRGMYVSIGIGYRVRTQRPARML